MIKLIFIYGILCLYSMFFCNKYYYEESNNNVLWFFFIVMEYNYIWKFDICVLSWCEKLDIYEDYFLV